MTAQVSQAAYDFVANFIQAQQDQLAGFTAQRDQALGAIESIQIMLDDANTILADLEVVE